MRSRALAARHAAIAQLRGRFRVAVNQDFADDDRALADGDELALIPPVAGGAERRHVGCSASRCRSTAASPRSAARAWAAS